MFRFENVSLSKFSNKKEVSILSGITMDIYSEKVTALIGPSGAGKSSLMRLLNRLEEPTAGRIYLAEKPLDSYNIFDLRRRVGMVFQLPVMFPGTVAENIHYAVRFCQSAGRLRPVPELLKMVGLDPVLADRSGEELSVGQQQRVAFARTLANNPEVLLLDEPTASLDPASATGILQLIKELQKQFGLTVLIITHLLDQAKNYSDYTGYLEKGQLIEFSRTSDIFVKPGHVAVRNFIAGGGEVA